MSSFEFYGRENFASCQYFSDEFFVVLIDARGQYPMLTRAFKAFKALQDEVFLFANGDAVALRKEVAQIIQILGLDLLFPPKKYAVFCQMAQELEAVFVESQLDQIDINFRWG